MNMNRRRFHQLAAHSAMGAGVASFLHADVRAQSIDVKEYLAQYFIGHYNPRGNHFCAFALKNQLVQLLDPKPVPYREAPTVLP